MTPRYPADPKFRRHAPKAMQGVFRVGMVVAVLMAGGLTWSWMKEKSGQSSPEATSPSPVVTAPAPLPPPVVQPVAKPLPATKPRSVLTTVELPPAREPVKELAKAAPPPPPPPVVENKPVVVESKPAVVAEVKESKPAKAAKPVVEPKEVEVVEETMDLTFYREFQDRHMILPAATPKTPQNGELVKPGAKPLPVAAKMVVPPAPVAVPVTQSSKSPNTWGWSERESRPEAGLASSGRYMVQVNVLPEFDKAAALANRLQRQGVNAHVVRTQSNGSDAYRVQVGPFSSREEANSKVQLWKTGGVVVPES